MSATVSVPMDCPFAVNSAIPRSRPQVMKHKAFVPSEAAHRSKVKAVAKVCFPTTGPAPLVTSLHPRGHADCKPAPL